MSADLRVSLASLPGFDPMGLVLHHSSVVEDPCLVLMVHSEDPRDLLVAFGAMGPSRFVPFDMLTPEYRPRDGWFLDLADAATRDRVARWMAGRVGLGVGSTAPEWHWLPSSVIWWLNVGNVGHYYPAGSYCKGIDPADDTRLPDGSRRVDAVALARVAVHVGGQP